MIAHKGSRAMVSEVWKKYSLKNGRLELVLLPGIGGRLWDVLFHGESLLFQNPDLVGMTPEVDTLRLLPSRASHIPFPLWGGEKTWISPEANWPGGTPHPVLDSSSYTVTRSSESSISMLSPVCPISGLQISRTISILDDLNDSSDSARFSIKHSLKNCGNESVQCGIWSVMMVDRPVTVVYPKNRHSPLKRLFGDSSDCLECNQNRGKVYCLRNQEFKVGSHPSDPIAFAYLSNSRGCIELASKPNVLASSEEYSHGHALEVYNSEHYDYAEIEWHSPAVNIAPTVSINLEVQYDISRIQMA
ncbi:hypothetical protein [Vibrio nigripulchritudo]|nr:hypothetical protein [Vibrio nigripulchritudo]